MKKSKAPKTPESVQVKSVTEEKPVQETLVEETPVAEKPVADAVVTTAPPKKENKLFVILVIALFILILIAIGALVLVSGVLNRNGSGVPVVTPTVSVTGGIEPTGTPSLTLTTTPTSTPSPTVTPTPGVLSATATVNVGIATSCPTSFVFSGRIYSPVAGDILYRWDRSDGTASVFKTLHFDTPGTLNTETESWTRGISGTGWGKLRVNGPSGAIYSPEAGFSLTCDHTGLWYTNFGTMRVTQIGLNASILFEDEFMGGSSTINGTFTADVFRSTYSGSPVTLTFSDAWQIVDGTFVNGRWCGAKNGYDFLAGCSFAGVWNEHVGGVFFESELCQPGDETLILTRRNNTVSGTYCNGTVTGTVNYDYAARTAYVIGTYSGRFGAHGPLGFYVRNGDYSYTQFVGNYNDMDFTWCGWRRGSSQPATCLWPIP